VIEALKRSGNRWRYRWRLLARDWDVRREIWSVEREIERSVSGSRPILLGPWTGEVGYEVLYWVPFLRWLAAAYRLPPARLVAVSRGGVAAWYEGIAGSYIDAFDILDEADFARRARERAAETGTSKQYERSTLDRELIDRMGPRLPAVAAAKAGGLQVVHPSLMYRLFRLFWSGQASMSFLEQHVRFARVRAPRVLHTAPAPGEYVAVKFYSARSLPATDEIRAALGSLVSSLAARSHVVLLDTNVRVDDHEDFRFDDIPNTWSAREAMTPRDNLAVQTQLIAGARAFVGTCGAVAWLAPMLGVETVPVLADAGFLHAHLHVARRAFARLEGAGTFSPCDVGALARLGLSVGTHA
jgi:hypothetical protein